MAADRPPSRPRRRWLAAGVALPAIAALPRFARGADPSYSQPGPFAVEVRDETWTDAARSRALPVRLHLPRGDSGPLPLVLFSHGLGGSREGGAAWLRHWATHGYLCLALQHPGSDETLWRQRAAGADLKASLRMGASPRAYVDRVRDVQFALDEASRRHDRGEAPWPRTDPARAGMSGHSFGARTTLAVAGERLPWPAEERGVSDPRVAAAIAFSPAAPGPAAGWPARFGGIQIPLLSVTGTQDGDVMGTGATPENRREPFRNMAAPDKFLLVLDGANHMAFNGGAMHAGTRVADVVRGVTLAFWDATLRGDAAARAWLANGAGTLLRAGDDFRRK